MVAVLTLITHLGSDDRAAVRGTIKIWATAMCPLELFRSELADPGPDELQTLLDIEFFLQVGVGWLHIYSDTGNFSYLQYCLFGYRWFGVSNCSKV